MNTEPYRQPYPTCPDCAPHPWHGLSCAKGGCACNSPFDDDFWKDGAQ